MLAALVVLLRSLALLCCGHRAVALENVALRQQMDFPVGTTDSNRRRDFLIRSIAYATTFVSHPRTCQARGRSATRMKEYWAAKQKAKKG
jgi:hypothetical protein